jgi:phosphatidylserine/phosphatidylglycerophosphate/cardiolipin synthase-like enzyme
MTLDQLHTLLQQSFADFRLTSQERQQLREALTDAALDENRRAQLRHKVFELARAALTDGPPRLVVNWLEEANKLLLPPTADGSEIFSQAYFSPGEQCVNLIVSLLTNTRQTADLCVFTVTDDRITAAIKTLHKRGGRVRLITDNDKALDEGSDAQALAHLGVPVVVDVTPFHMHHKFAIFDRALLVTGSYNWTRSAAQNNEENLVFSNDRKLVKSFEQEFEKLWQTLGGHLKR